MSDSELVFVEDSHNDEYINPQEMHKTVSILHLICISFFYVCAGPFGQGEVIAAGGAKWTFVFTLLVPIIFSVPLALISSEQASRMPTCGGCAEWGLILGQFMGYVNTYVRTLCSIFDNAIYPVMACDYLATLIPKMNTIGYRTLVVILSNILVIILNISGLETVGSISIILTIITVLPFFLFFLFGASKMTVSKVFADKPIEYGPIDWSLLLSTLIWQFSGFDTVAALSEETKDPKRTFPIALTVTIVLVTAVYLLPTVSGVSIETDLNLWANCAFSEISKKLPYCQNGWLSYWISIAGVISAISLLNIAISCTARETYAGAVIGSLPLCHFLGRMNKNAKNQPLPIVAIVFMAVMTIPFSFFNFTLLVEWSGLLTVIQQMIQIAAFIALRIPSMVKKMRTKQAVLKNCQSDPKLSSYDSIARLSNNSLEDELKILEDSPQIDLDDEDLSNKFIIPGGWFGVAIVCIPLTAICIFLCIVEGWLSLVISVALITGMFILKGIDLGITKMILMCRMKDAKYSAKVANVSNFSNEDAPNAL